MSAFLGSSRSRSKPSTPTPVATVQPKPVVKPAPVVPAPAAGQKEETSKSPKSRVRRGVPRRMSSAVLGGVAGETRKAKLGD